VDVHVDVLVSVSDRSEILLLRSLRHRRGYTLSAAFKQGNAALVVANPSSPILSLLTTEGNSAERSYRNSPFAADGIFLAIAHEHVYVYVDAYVCGKMELKSASGVPSPPDEPQ